MASITVQERTTILKLVAGMFNAAPGATYLNEFTDAFVALNKDFGALAAALGNTAPFQSLYPSYLTAEEFANKFLATLGLKDNTEAQDWVQARKNAGEDNASIIFQALVAIEASTADEFKAARDQLANKAKVAEHYSVTLGQSSDSLATLQGVVASITADNKTVEDAIGNTGGNAGNFTLTHLADYLTGTAGDDVFQAPVSQNGTGSGVLANTFETGDVIDGGAGRNTLKADLIATGTASDFANEVAISATTKNIQEVYLRQQTPQNDQGGINGGNNSTIDAEKMAGVEQWWTDNSRSNIQVEDIRTDTAATTFGMRLTDPGVSFFNYFNALFLEGDKSATSAVTLNIYEGPLGSPDTAKQLANISVYNIKFQVAGETFTLASDAMKAANTWDELEAAIKDELAKIEGAETITVTNRGNGQFVLEDSAAREFQVNAGEALVVSVANNITFTNALTVGREEVVGPIVSNAVLDGAGNGSQGGTLNIGAMSGLRGVEELNLTVDRDSHLQSITSYNRVPDQYGQLRNGEANEFLEVVDLASTGANGDLTVGRSTATLDGRVAIWGDQDGNGVADADRVAAADGLGNSGFINLREFNAGDFAGALNVAFTLDNNAIGRYLDPATDVVTFAYNGGAQNDIFNIADISTGGAVSSDQDFAMNVDLGAGDDRLVISVPTVRAVSVDGGEGTNSIVVANSHGTTAANTFAGFANFQTYEVEGVTNTEHDFTSMSGVQNVVIATGDTTPTAGGNTQLIDLEAAQNVTISGKNQTIGNASTADQNFGTIQLTNDAGADRTITLDNTARLSNSTNGVRQDGVLTVAALTIDETATGNSATTNVTIDSAGARTVANAVRQFNGRDVQTLNLVGTQDLTIDVNRIADQATAAGVTASTALDITGAALQGDLNLAITGAMIGNWGTATGLTDRIVGTAGTNDTLMLWGTQGNDAVTVTGFETIQFGNANTTMFGDLDITAAGGVAIDATGIYDAQNTAATNYVIADDIVGNTALTLNNLGTGVTVNMGDANRDATGAVVNSQVFDDVITLNSGAVAGTPAAAISVNYLSNIVGGQAMALTIGTVVAAPGNDTNGYQTVNLNVAHAGNLTGVALASDARTMALTLTEDTRELNLTGGFDNNAGVRDSLTFLPANALPNALTRVDLTGYEGNVALTMEQGAVAGATQTDVRFVLSEDNATITLSNLNNTLIGAAGVQHNSIFEFTAAKTTADVSVWTVSNVVGSGALSVAAGATTDNITRFDLTDLGITSFDQISISAVDFTGAALAAGTFAIRSEAQDDASILTGTNQNTWEIKVTGGAWAALAAGEITADNFIFA